MSAGLDREACRVPGLESKHLRQQDVARALDRALEGRRGATRSIAGRSAEGRIIERVELGIGDVTVLVWSQMHGNEPSGTMALIDLIAFLAAREAPIARRIADGIRLVALPMLNPDGAERFERRNAQGIDLNRDALALASPEISLVTREFDALQPAFAISLHDQEPRKRVGSSRRRTAYSIAAPQPDPLSGLTGRDAQLRAKRVLADLRPRVEALVDDRLTRYEVPYEPRALCDNFQSRGTCTLLFEAAAWENDANKQYLRGVHFEALVLALQSIASRSYERADPDDYGALPENGEEPLADVIIRGATVCVPGRPPYVADIALRYDEPLARSGAKIQDVGDLRDLDGAFEVDATGLFVHVEASSLENGVPAQDCPARLTARVAADAAAAAVWHVDEGPVTPATPATLNPS